MSWADSLGNLFGSVATGVKDVYTAVNTPRGYPVPGVPGAIYPNSFGPQYGPPLPVSQQGVTFNTTTLLLLGVGAFLIWKYS